MPDASLYVRVPPSQVGMFRFLLETWDNLALATTLERDTAIVKVCYAQESEGMVRQVLADMRRSVEVQVLDVPMNGAVSPKPTKGVI